MGVFGKLFKHPSEEDKHAKENMPQADPLSEPAPIDTPVPVDSETSPSEVPPTPTQAPTQKDDPLQTSASSPDTSQTDQQTPHEVSTDVATSMPEITAPTQMEIPPEYELAPEPVVTHHEPVHQTEQQAPEPMKQELPAFEESDEPVHMSGKIHIPPPKKEELIVKEIYVERDHFIELLSALHIARHDIEKNLSGKMNIEQTDAETQAKLDSMQETFEKMQKHTLVIEGVLGYAPKMMII